MTNTSPQTQRIHAPEPGRYRLVPDRSSVAFRTRHLFGLAPVSGTMRVVAGTIVVDPTVPEATVSASSFSTGSGRRDRDVRKARFLHAEEHPELTFMAGVLEQAQGRWTLAGELTVRGVSQPVTLAIDGRDDRPGAPRPRDHPHRQVRLRSDLRERAGSPLPRRRTDRRRGADVAPS